MTNKNYEGYKVEMERDRDNYTPKIISEEGQMDGLEEIAKESAREIIRQGFNKASVKIRSW